MSEIPFQVIHKIPGRIRVKIPRLKGNPDYAVALQQEVQSLTAVKAVRVNSAAQSITINYDAHATSEVDLNKELVTAIQSNSPVAPPSPENILPDNEVIQLTPYEKTQFEAIKNWQHRKIFWLRETIGHLLMASTGVLSFLLPNQVLEKIGSACESVTNNWLQDWEELKPVAEVEDASALRRSSLETCDRLTDHVTNNALNKATAVGGITGIFNIFGQIVGEGLTIVDGLRTIHRIGLCYGYQPQTAAEQTFAWAIFQVALAQTQEEFEQSQIKLRQLQRSLNKQALEDETLQESLEEDVDEMAIDSAIEQGITQLTGQTFAGVVPVLSILMSAVSERDMIEQISTAAKREFQWRWLLENGKVRLPETSTV